MDIKHSQGAIRWNVRWQHLAHPAYPLLDRAFATVSIIIQPCQVHRFEEPFLTLDIII
jgi:hypothetical protein